MSLLMEVQNLTKTYHTAERTVEVLRGVSFSLQEGECVGILGASGTGKSTIGQIITGLTSPDGGQVLYQGQVLSYPLRGQVRQEIQILFQHPEMSFNPKYAIKQGFRELYRAYHLPYNEEIFYESLSPYGLYPEHMERKPIQLSGGELQRAMIARTMLLKPRVIVLDEPTSMLDTISQAQVLHMLQDIQKKANVAFLYITHNHILADYMCHKKFQLESGLLVPT